MVVPDVSTYAFQAVWDGDADHNRVASPVVHARIGKVILMEESTKAAWPSRHLLLDSNDR